MKFAGVVMCFLIGGLFCPGLAQGQEQQPVQVGADQDRIKGEISKRWDQSSEKYDSHHGHGVQSGEEAAAWRELFGRLIPGKGLRILDAGCGTGEMSFILADMGHEVYGLDISKSMLAKAAEKAKTKTDMNGGRIQFQLGDAEKPPYDNNFFDAVICRHVLWTLPSPQTAIDSWTKILKDNGRIIVIDAWWDDGSLSTRMKKKLGSWLRYLSEKQSSSSSYYSPSIEAALPHAKGVPLEKARVYLEQAGLQDLQDEHLDRLVEIQRKHMPLWYRISYTYDYYAVSGQKRAVN